MAPSNSPSISPKTRTAIYYGCLLVNVVSFVGFGLAALFGWLPAEEATAAGVIVIGGINMVSTGLAVGYRPTRPGH